MTATLPVTPAAGPDASLATTERDSVAHWVQRARRARELVSQLDLVRVRRHDTEELDKLGQITAALAGLLKADTPAPRASTPSAASARRANAPQRAALPARAAARHPETPATDQLTTIWRYMSRATD